MNAEKRYKTFFHFSEDFLNAVSTSVSRALPLLNGGRHGGGMATMPGALRTRTQPSNEARRDRAAVTPRRRLNRWAKPELSLKALPSPRGEPVARRRRQVLARYRFCVSDPSGEAIQICEQEHAL